MIEFNKPFVHGDELKYIKDVFELRILSGNGKFTKDCQQFFENKYGFKKSLLTSSGTDALEMIALLLNIQPGDEVIVPSFTFTTTAIAFVLRGAKIVFADSDKLTPNIDLDSLVSLITPRTKAVMIIHYAGIACDMDRLNKICKDSQISLVEDAAHAIDAFYRDQPLGTFGLMSAFSFHETKNIISGEGGMLALNDPQLFDRAEILWEKGTNRVQFYKGAVNKYNWVDVGSSFLPSEITAAFLFGQLNHLEVIQQRRLEIWHRYNDNLISRENDFHFRLPVIPDFAKHNAHIFYLRCGSKKERDELISFLSSNDIMAVFHYLPLHLSPYFEKLHDRRKLSQSESWSDCIIRLPLYYELTDNQVDFISEKILAFYAR